jgi:probable DNA repair protein
MLAWFDQARAMLAAVPVRSGTGWAECFSLCLRAAGFATGRALDSRDAQRLERWAELLDEFAGLDAAMPPLDCSAALQALRRLARQSMHQVATGDAAITFSTRLDDPVAQYDGIWVMGLTENRWPAPPRPDPYVPLHEQRRCGWPQAGVTQRLLAAGWLQRRWQLRTGNLVLSYARQEADVRHRPSALLARFDGPWEETEVAAAEPLAMAAAAGRDAALPPMSTAELALPLRGGVERLRVQQECAFRAQAQWRLGAEAPASLTDGIPPRLRGILLHSVLEGLWEELRDQQRLLALSPDSRAALVARHWSAALRDNAAAGVAWLAPGVLERECLRTARLLERVLALESARAPFSVQLREHEVAWRHDPASLVMRIDRIDQTATGQQLLVDYKSGTADSIRLHEGEARPLQLAAYVVALADAGIDVDAALLLGLSPAQPGYAGASGMEEALPGRVKQVEDWPLMQLQWRRELAQLLADHLRGSALLAENSAACRYCHLPAFCRRRAAGEASPEEGGDE